jgi:hypothetical protein
LPSSRSRPPNFDSIDGSRIAKTDFLPQRICPEASTAIDGAIDLSRPFRCSQGNPEACADGRAIGFCSHEFKFQPLICVAGIQEESIAREIAGIRA